MNIDFIAGHPLLAQGAQSVYEALKDKAACQWHIGRPIAYTGGAALILIDHVHHHPDFYKWKYKFYLMHDLGDVDDYKRERKILRQFTTVIVPDETHAVLARRYLTTHWWHRGAQVFTGGWPKYDELLLPDSELAKTLEALPDQPTILYAPSWAAEEEWRQLFPALAALPVNVIIKNHPYATAPREVVSDYYKRSRQLVEEMETTARQLKMVVTPRDCNICTLFPYVDTVISDQSSVAAEFLPFGLSIETGANPNGPAVAEISRWYPQIIYRPLPQLLAELKNLGWAKKNPRQSKNIGKHIADFIWQELCT